MVVADWVEGNLLKVIGISSLSSLGYVKVYTHITGDVEIVQITKDELLLRLTTRQVTKFETSQSGARPVEFSRSTERMSDLKKKTEKYAQEKWILKVNRRPKEEELRYGDGTMKADVSLRAHTLLVYVAPYQITFDGIRKQDHVIRKQDHVIYLWIFNHNRSSSDLLLDSCKRSATDESARGKASRARRRDGKVLFLLLVCVSESIRTFFFRSRPHCKDLLLLLISASESFRTIFIIIRARRHDGKDLFLLLLFASAF